MKEYSDETLMDVLRTINPLALMFLAFAIGLFVSMMVANHYVGNVIDEWNAIREWCELSEYNSR